MSAVLKKLIIGPTTLGVTDPAVLDQGSGVVLLQRHTHRVAVRRGLHQDPVHDRLDQRLALLRLHQDRGGARFSTTARTASRDLVAAPRRPLAGSPVRFVRLGYVRRRNTRRAE